MASGPSLDGEGEFCSMRSGREKLVVLGEELCS